MITRVFPHNSGGKRLFSTHTAGASNKMLHPKRRKLSIGPSNKYAPQHDYDENNISNNNTRTTVENTNSKAVVNTDTDKATTLDQLISQFSSISRTHASSNAGPGFSNLGNTCFMNAVLQCITHTPLMQWLCLSRPHSNTCTKDSFCGMCQFEKLYNATTTTHNALAPKMFAANIRKIASHFVPGRQQDSHEFFIYLIDSMHSAFPKHKVHIIPGNEHVVETSPIYQSFSGISRTEVLCNSCGYRSHSFENFVGLSLDLNSSNTGAQSVYTSLDKYTTPEILSKSNQYKCERCKNYVNAQKQVLLHTPPNTLAIHLKRFSSTGYGKISSFLKYPSTLEISKYCCDKKNDVVYDLYGVLVHAGSTPSFGHYYSYARNLSGSDRWFLYDDSMVSESDVRTALGQSAYILFYSKRPGSGIPPKPTVSPNNNDEANDLDAKPSSALHSKGNSSRNNCDKFNENPSNNEAVLTRTNGHKQNHDTATSRVSRKFSDNSSNNTAIVDHSGQSTEQILNSSSFKEMLASAVRKQLTSSNWRQELKQKGKDLCKELEADRLTTERVVDRMQPETRYLPDEIKSFSIDFIHKYLEKHANNYCKMQTDHHKH